MNAKMVEMQTLMFVDSSGKLEVVDSSAGSGCQTRIFFELIFNDDGIW